MLDYSPEAVEICSTPLAAGDAVKVIKGPLAGLEGELVMIGGKSKVAVRLDMLGCAHVDMPIGYVERINFNCLVFAFGVKTRTSLMDRGTELPMP